MRMILNAWFNLPEDTFSYYQAQFELFCPPMKTSCSPSPTENINDTTSLAYTTQSFPRPLLETTTSSIDVFSLDYVLVETF